MNQTDTLAQIMTECDAYVNAIADYQIEIEGKTEYTSDSITIYESRESIKVLLIEFLAECEQTFQRSKSDLLQLLRRNRHHFEATQGITIKKLNEIIETTNGEERARSEDKKERFLNYFHHNYALIDLIRARLTKSPLSEHLQFKLKRVGLDWIANSTRSIPPSSTVPTTKPEFLPQFKRATRDLAVTYTNGTDYMDLHNLGIALRDKIEAVIHANRETGKNYLKEQLMACLDELPYAESGLHYYRDKLFKELPYEVYDKFENARNIYYTIEDTISILVKLLISQFPDSYDKSLVLTKKTMSIADLVERFLPAYDPIRRELTMKARVIFAPATSTPSATDEQKNIFNRMPLDEVRRWVIQLAENNSKNGAPFLTVEQVDEFIERAFIGKTVTDKLSINTNGKEKGKIVGLFHAYFGRCNEHLNNIGKIDPTASADKYKLLLTNYFDNWSFDEVKSNFRQGGDWKNKP